MHPIALLQVKLKLIEPYSIKGGLMEIRGTVLRGRRHLILLWIFKVNFVEQIAESWGRSIWMIAMSYYPDQVAQPAYAGIVYVFADALKLHFIEHVLIIDRTKKKDLSESKALANDTLL